MAVTLPLGTCLIVSVAFFLQLISQVFNPFKAPALFCLSSTELTTGFGFFLNFFSLFLYPFFHRGILHFLVAAIPFVLLANDLEKVQGTFGLLNILFVVVITL
jgi:membrane associated rhomboid family serine protease